jgi:hypothetical protein
MRRLFHHKMMLQHPRHNAWGLAAAVVIAIILLTLGRAAQASPGPATLHVIPIDATTSHVVARNVGIAPGAQPAVAWDVYFNFDHAQGRLESVEAGPVWKALDCGFSTNIVTNPELLPTTNDVIVNGFCTTRLPQGVSGDEVLLFALNWADCRQGFIVDLRTGAEEFGGPVSDMFDANVDPYEFADDELFDGGACGDTTVGLQTTLENPVAQPSPLLTSAPLLAAVVGTALVIVVAAVFLVKRRAG